MKLAPQFLMMRPEESLHFFMSSDKKVVSVERRWNGQPTYQLQGDAEHLETILETVLPKTIFRDERGREP